MNGFTDTLKNTRRVASRGTGILNAVQPLLISTAEASLHFLDAPKDGNPWDSGQANDLARILDSVVLSIVQFRQSQSKIWWQD
jgi:hypothetical protein